MVVYEVLALAGTQNASAFRESKTMWSDLHKENDVRHGNKTSSVAIRVDVTPIQCTIAPK